jgi:hypothetical protein
MIVKSPVSGAHSAVQSLAEASMGRKEHETAVIPTTH